MLGTPESIADEIEHWYRTGAADGFNLMPPMCPHGLDDFVDHIISVLQERGLFRRSYEGAGSLRGMLQSLCHTPAEVGGTPDAGVRAR